ncbi:sulfite exporter TauE/SafE family protein [Beijerinckia indica]|nr:sulfite exporter TauE/SafE family protein [Beijerinckia indica]
MEQAADPMISFVVIFIVSLFAFAVSTVSGGGAGLVLIPILGLAVPVAQVPAALSIGTVTSSLSRIAVFRRSIRWDVVRWFVPSALPFSVLGAWVLTRVSPLYLELLLGCFLVSNIVFVFRSSQNKQTHTKRLPNSSLVLIGAAAGFISGFTGAVGLVFNQFYLRYGMRKEEIVATRAANEILLHAMKLALYFSFGLLTEQSFLAGVLVAIAAVLASFMMHYLLPYISEIFFRRVGYLAMCAAGVAMFMSAGSQLAMKDGLAVDYELHRGGEPEAKLHWRHYVFSVEFNHLYDMEFERIIPLSILPTALQEAVQQLAQNADETVIEEIFGLGSHNYEVSVRDGESIRKYHF